MARALNRHHTQRMKKRRATCLTVCGRNDNPRVVGMVTNTPKPCSCWMCGNKRKSEGPTLQELRGMEA